MEKRKYKGQEDVSLLGFGLMRLPKVDPDKPDIDFEPAAEMVDYAYRHGVTYFDTAWPYHQGLSEPFAGQVLTKYPRESYQLATKLPTWLLKSEADVDEYFGKQLERCKTDYFDFYLVHSLSDDSWPNVAKYNVYEQLKEKQRQGKIRRLGFSFHFTPELLEEITDTYEWDFAQIQLNYVDWELQDAKREYEILKSRGIPVVIMEPVRGGALVTLCQQSIDIFKKADPDASIASWAVRYAASLPEVITVLSGMSTLEQVKDNVKTMTPFKPLSDAERVTIDEALEAYRKTGTIPCTACRYCMDCPAGVDIPKTFAIYNDYKVKEIPHFFQGNYELMGESKQAHNCIECGACVPLCPQGIDIPANMKLIAELNIKLNEKTE